MCPDGFVIIREHSGILSNLDYCIDQAYKHNAYDRIYYVTGENPILIMNSVDGGDSATCRALVTEPFFLCTPKSI